VLVALLLLLGGVESNPGPTSTANDATQSTAPRRNSTSLGLLNVCSARHKAALIHDVIADNHLDVFVMTETWIPSDAPNAIKLDVAPTGYSVVHRHRGSSADRRNGGVALVHRDTIKASVIDVGDYTKFELLAVKLVGRRAMTHNYLDSVPIWKVARSLSSLAITSHQPSDTMAAFLRGPSLVLCCSQTSPFASATPISYNRGITLLSEYIFAMF